MEKNNEKKIDESNNNIAEPLDECCKISFNGKEIIASSCTFNLAEVMSCVVELLQKPEIKDFFQLNNHDGVKSQSIG